MNKKRISSLIGLIIICTSVFNGCAGKNSVFSGDAQANELYNEATPAFPETTVNNKYKGFSSEEETEQADPVFRKNNTLLRVFNKNGQFETEIFRNRPCILVNNGFIYMQKTENKLSEQGCMNYYYYSLDTHESHFLDTVEDWSYQCSYDDILVKDHLYSVISTGNLYEGTLKCYLYDFDLSNYTSERFVLPGTVPYCSLAYLDGDVYIGVIGGEDYYVLKYNVQTRDMTKLDQRHYSEKNDSNDILRHVSSDGKYIYLLRIRTQKGEPSVAFLDKYEKAYDLIETTNITEYLHSPYADEWMLDDELRQLVSHFDIKNDYAFYENFSMSRSLINLTSNNASSLISLGPDDHKALSVDPGNTDFCFYEANGDIIHCFNTETGNSIEVPVDSENKNLRIWGVSTDSTGNAFVLLHNTNVNDEDSIDEAHFINLFS